MRVAVTGSHGLIGAAVVGALKSANVVRIGRRDDCDLKADISDPQSLSCLGLEGVDALVHCAGVVDEDFVADRERAFRQATLGMSALVDRARSSGVRHFVYISTAHVYGPLVGSVTEASPPNPLSDYAIAHFASEQFLRRMVDDVFWGTIIRPCAVFGIPPDLGTFRRWSLIPFAFPKSAVTTHEIVLKSAGTQIRNFVGAADIAELVSEELASGPRPALRTRNAVGAYSGSVADFAQLCAEVYHELAGRSCSISQLEGVAAKAEDFSYGSHFVQPPGCMDIRKVVRMLMEQLICASADGGSQTEVSGRC